MSKTLLSILLVTISQLSFSQDVYNKMARKLCKCLEREKVDNIDGVTACMEPIMFDNISEIIDYHEVSSITEIDGNEVGQILMARLAKDCFYARTLSTNSINSDLPNYTPDKNISCQDLQIGNYYYLTPDQNGRLRDTTFVTFTKSEYFERMNRGRTYSRLALEWETDCSFVLKFIESNDPFKNNYSKPGDTYHYEIIKKKENSIILKTSFDNQEVQFECVML